MKINNVKILAITIFVLVGTPFVSEASSAIRLSDTTFLFTVDFMVNEPQFTIGVPIAAKSGVTYQDRVDYMGYTVKAEGQTDAKIEELNAIVLATNAIEGVRYQAPIGAKSDFTLFILATFDQKIEDNRLQAMITKFPYFLDGRRTTMHQNQLDELPAPVIARE